MPRDLPCAVLVVPSPGSRVPDRLAWLLAWRCEPDRRGLRQWYGLCGWFEADPNGWRTVVEWVWSVHIRPIGEPPRGETLGK